VKVRLQMMVQDPRFAPVEGAKRRIEGYDVSGVPFFDGPATDRVIVKDMDASGQVFPGTRFVAPKHGSVLGKFDLPKPEEIDLESRAFNQISAMATVLKTIAMYEDADVLGRRVRWNFPEPQLTVVPRIGIQENAFYSRGKRRLEFYSFQSHVPPHEMIYTSLSRDIVGHETGHAILDGIAPDLLDCRTPQSLAMHEAIGDISGLLVATASSKLRLEVLAKTKGSIDNANAFSAIAEQFGMARGTGALRDLRNDKRLADVNQSQPHSLSQVLSGALYAVFTRMYNRRWEAYSEPTDNALARYSRSGKALWDTRQQFKRMTLRALDYLPRGQITFADYARAVIAADQASHPDDTEERAWLKMEFVKRGIVPNEAALDVVPPAADFIDADLDLLLRDGEAARAFAMKHSKLLRIPEGRTFTVDTPMKVIKKYYHRTDDGAEHTEASISECLIKVSWSEPEFGPGRLGTTLAIDWDSRKPRVLLSSDHSDRPDEAGAQAVALAGLTEEDVSIPCCP
jgi:hypothetical protein